MVREMEPLLEIKNLEVCFRQDGRSLRALRGVDLTIKKGEILGLVGESGCGKSVTALSITKLLPMPPAEISGGEIIFDNQLLLEIDDRKLHALRGGEISYIFQEPATSLNPVFSIGDQIAESIKLHTEKKGTRIKERVIELLRLVGIPLPEERFSSYPHELSGGMKQRVMIAMAICSNPALLIADEPTTALDVTVQAGILALLKNLRETINVSILLITHDLGIVSHLADKVAVMYTGKIVELCDTKSLYTGPRHPYTKGLINCIPKIEHAKEKLAAIPGSVPDVLNLPSGCKFNPRCPIGDERCREEEPIMREIEPGHFVRCYKA